MRKKIVAGNWKMNNSYNEALELVKGLLGKLNNTDRQVILAPSFPFLKEVSEMIKKNNNVFLCAQNMHEEDKGAYTGEVSGEMLVSVGCTHAIIGHSERRAQYGENEVSLSKKVNKCLARNITPIYCCGEKLEDRQSGNHFSIVETQIQGALFHLVAEELKGIIIAYEPVWAIGTGETATVEEAQEMHAFIRSVLSRKYGNELAESISILYGGSCKPENAKELFNCEDVDGGLIGGASLNVDDFIGVINA